MSNMKNTKSKVKPIKTGKELGTTYCLGCKDFTRNFSPKEVKTTSKVPVEKSNCFKSRFLKQKHNNKKQITVLQTDVIKKHANFPANIHLDEDVFRLRLQKTS